MKALIVDDEYDYLRLLGHLLEQNGYTTILCRDGLHAWDELQKAQQTEAAIQLVITDWMMPGLEGPQLIRRIREANFSHYTFIILMTARASRPDMIEGYQSGADDYLIKPFEPNEVLARLSIAKRILNLEKILVDQKEQMAIMASYDEVTGLLNRRKMSEIALVEMARSQRQNEPISMVMMDLDYFKSVNDRFGHSAGDMALKLVAEVINANKRPYDQVSRWGGEEFLIMLPGATMEVAVQIAERLRVSLANTPLYLPNHSAVYLSASFGVAGSSHFPLLDFENLVRLADQALYRAKTNGRNRVERASD
jgi:two-component system chemotaxis response regulator CheY